MKQKTIKDDLKKLRKSRQFLTILMLLFVAVLFWIFVSILGSQKKEAISAELKLLSLPLTPNIDRETVAKIEAKKSYSDTELSKFTIYKILSSRDGKEERIVPLEVTIDDIDPKDTPRPKATPEGQGSLLDSELIIENDDSSASDQPTPTISETPESPSTLLGPISN